MVTWPVTRLPDQSKPCSYVCGVALCIWNLVGMALKAPYIRVLFQLLLLRYSDWPWIDQLLLEWCLPLKVLFVYMLTSSCVFILFSSLFGCVCLLIGCILMMNRKSPVNNDNLKMLEVLSFASIVGHRLLNGVVLGQTSRPMLSLVPQCAAQRPYRRWSARNLLYTRPLSPPPPPPPPTVRWLSMDCWIAAWLKFGYFVVACGLILSLFIWASVLAHML